MPEQPGMAVGERRGLALPGRSVAGGWGAPWDRVLVGSTGGDAVPVCWEGKRPRGRAGVESTEGTWPVWGWPCWGVTDSIKTS